MFTLVDDGTLDTVVECSECSAWERYNYASYCEDGQTSASEDEFAYDRFIEWALDDAADTHECVLDEGTC